MKARVLVTFVVAVIVVLVVRQAQKQPQHSPMPQPVTALHDSQDAAPAAGGRPAATTTTANATPSASSASGPQLSPSPAAAVSAVPATVMAANLAQPSTPSSAAEEPSTAAAAILLENLRTTVRQYGLRFGGNPVGTNQEITKALNGGNPRHVEFLGPDGNRINDNGELVDAWGTPYFFHQLSGQVMEIRSAGPDKRMWTGDDLVIR
jgi:hypothetical protein